MSDAKWYCAKNGEALGPFDFAQLRQMVMAGTVTPTDLVCQEGASEWVAAQTVPGLLPSLPPLPGGNRTKPSQTKLWWWASEYAGVGLIGAFSSLFSPDLRTASGIAAMGAALVVFMSADGYPRWARIGLTVLAAVVGASAGAITYSIGFFLVGAALSAAVGGGLGLGYAMTVVKGRIRRE